MQYREIVAVTGMGGLFHLQATKADGAIVRNLADNTTKFIPARLHNVTPLESIEVYTNGANVRLHEVLQAMKDSSTALPDAKKGNDAAIRGYFKDVYPDLDDSRVYTSDLKKMVKWFELLKNADLLDFSALNAPEEEEAGSDEGAEANVPEGAVEDAATPSLEAEAQLAEEAKADETGMAGLAEEGGAPAKKARARKADEPGAEGEEKPVKKAAPRKKKAEGESDAGEDESAPKKTARKKKGDDEAA